VGVLADPSVLLLDEPSSALDPRQRARLWEFLASLAKGGTAIVFSTHDVTEAERHADRVLVLADGELLFSGTTGELEQLVDTAQGGARGRHHFETAFVDFLRQQGH
jgi:ABC-2 type transport system ATP-binding protein